MADDFYVKSTDCMACGAPPVAAPELMILQHGYEGCCFVRQPKTNEEIDQAIQGMQASCCGAVRYRGSNPVILRKIVAAYLNSSYEPPIDKQNPNILQRINNLFL